MADNSKALLEQLQDLEKGLSQFSFQSLTAEEAKQLKTEFHSFGHQLKDHLWGEQPEKQVPSANPPELKQSWKLLAEVGHEIRTPLAGIVSMTDLLRDSSLTKEQQEWTIGIHKAAQSLLNLSGEILELSAIGSQKSPKNKIEFNLPALINDQVFLCKTLLMQKDVQLQCSIDPGVPTYLWGDSSSLSQILLNILGNAVKYVEQGRIHFDVRVAENKDELCYLEFRIADTGIGIADEELERIFDAYARGLHEKEGKGLGLAIVKELVEQLGGCLVVESKIGEGSTFSVILPYARKASVAVELTPPAVKEEKPGVTSFKGKNILLIEDDFLQQRWLQHRLKETGAITQTTYTAQQGLDALLDKNYDLVILDCKLPDFSAWEFLSRYQHYPQQEQPQFIVCSAQWTKESQEKAVQHGIQFTLEKPFAGTELLETIQRALNNDPKPPQKRLVDLSGLLQECQGNLDLLDELADLFKQNILEFLGQCRIHLQASNAQGVSFAAHKVKSSLLMIQAAELHALCDQLDESAKENESLTYLESLYSRFLEAYPATERALEWEIAHLKSTN